MKKYRKKPLVIHAIKWSGKDTTELEEMLAHERDLDGIVNDYYFGWAPGDGDLHELVINTLEGQMTAEIGDYIIRGIKGELYPVKPDVFHASYEEVPD